MHPKLTPPPFWSETSVFGKLASTVAEIRRGPNFLDAALAQTPAKFGPKRCFLVS